MLATDGVEQVELDEPWQALVEAGAEPALIGLSGGSITAYDHIQPGGTRTVDVPLADADPDSFDALVLPAGSSTATSSGPTPTRWPSCRRSSTRASRWRRSATHRGC